ncbi:DNA-directed RNA polymerase, beta subunit/140 kD subunit [Solibacillus silvestris StLB046]|uniref:DNA-directed RNA polymerase, beta subunit/140 kD subunit n=1 Tax=Solibacillus silvestris (strain StLB046) TaxID=1002809 RepID=F2F574_SOLSS|nr:DUF5819 family protein [Solibacillus silvestris]BAK18150.1 DNA-directed RNA polymerase, beta subunit/140 kD subunit [Solibacillus silvestris StLB046]
MKKKIAFFLLITVIFVFHFSMTALYVLPFNPLASKYNHQIQSYMNPLFTQNWQLFAPNPLSQSIYVNVQIKDTEGQESKWIDFTTPLLEANHKNRFSPVNTIVRLGQSAYLQSVHIDPLTEKIATKNIEIDEVSQRLSDYQKDGVYILYKLGLHYAEQYFESSKISDIRIRVIKEESIPFSQRNNPDYENEIKYSEHDWVPVKKIKSGEEDVI